MDNIELVQDLLDIYRNGKTKITLLKKKFSFFFCFLLILVTKMRKNLN